MKCRIQIKQGTGVLWDQEFQVANAAEAFKAGLAAWLTYADSTIQGQLNCTIDLEVE